MGSSQKSFFVFLLHVLVLHFVVLLTRAENITHAPEAIYVLGDSLVDVGNNNHIKLSIIKADFPHNGVDYPDKKATGRFSNGKNAVDFLAEKVGLPTSPPYLQNVNQNFLKGVNFASGGAGILNTTNDGTIHRAISLTRQVEMFGSVVQKLEKQLNTNGVHKHISNSLFVIVIGSNDMFGYFGSNSEFAKTTSPQQYVDMMISTFQFQFKALHMLGARKFLIVGVGVIGCCPSQRIRTKTGECKEDINLWTTKYNQQLKVLLEQLKSTLGDINYTYFDTYGALSKLITNPSTYGFTAPEEACCGLGKLRAEFACLPISHYCANRNEHIFWDLYHPTEATDRILVDFIYNGQEFVTPINLQQLINST
ncbi:hypothetical protein Leryth_010127 [Lithospermum erythrorhizon]|nr:hypothetical protein Leryth_010127 [Lithospermum erythrorhizon]